MKVAPAILLLLLQLRPLVGAAVCLQNIAAQSECPMPADAAPGQTPAPSPPDQSHGLPTTSCPAAAYCAALAPAIGSLPTILSAPGPELVAGTAFLTTLHSIDTPAPLPPPPNN